MHNNWSNWNPFDNGQSPQQRPPNPYGHQPGYGQDDPSRRYANDSFTPPPQAYGYPPSPYHYPPSAYGHPASAHGYHHPGYSYLPPPPPGFQWQAVASEHGSTASDEPTQPSHSYSHSPPAEHPVPATPSSSFPSSSTSVHASEVTLASYTPAHAKQLYAAFKHDRAFITQHLHFYNSITSSKELNSSLGEGRRPYTTIFYRDRNRSAQPIPVGIIGGNDPSRNPGGGIKILEEWVGKSFSGRGIFQHAKRAYIERA